MTVDELHGTLTAYEMRIEQEDSSGKEATFKTSNKRGTSKPKTKSKDNINDEFDSEEEANFVRKLKRGAGKYKGKLPLICFECGKIGHFASKCPYVKDQNSDDEINYKKSKSSQKFKKRNNGRSAKGRNLYSKGNNNTYDDDSNSDNDSEKVLFIAMDMKEITEDHDDPEEEGEVDLEEKFISALEELHKERKKNMLLKKELRKIREDTYDSTISEELKQAYLDLKVHLEEATVIEESLRKRLEETKEIQKEL